MKLKNGGYPQEEPGLNMMQYNFFPPESDWVMPLSLPEIDEDFAIDTETYDPHLKTKAPGFVPGGKGYIAGISVKSANHCFYAPIRHQEGSNMNIEYVIDWMKRHAAKPVRKFFANAQYDVGWLRTEGVEFDPKLIHDVLIMAPLLDENKRRYNLDGLAKDYGFEGKDEALLKEAASVYGFKGADTIKANMWRMPAKYVGPYAEADADMTYKLAKLFLPMIERQELEYVYNLEMRLVPIMLEMRTRGLRVDLEKARAIKKDFMNRENHAKLKLRKLAGFPVDPYSPKSCAAALSNCGIEYPMTAAGNPSITADFLETMDHEIGIEIRNARKYQKAYSTFIDGYILDRHINGRVFASFNQLPSEEGGTVSGRFSCSGPNLQNIPARDPEIGPLIRSLFLPEEGEYWMAADYANQEPRITVSWAYKCGLQGSEKVVNIYQEDPYVSYHKIIQGFIEDFVPDHLDPYKTAKAINLGLAYGMGGAKLCSQLGLPTKMIQHWTEKGKMVEVAGDEGQEILDKYGEEVPYIKGLTDLCTRRARKRGFIKTLSGRRCRFPNGFEHKALNRLVQGTAADQTKEAMIKMHEAGHTMILTMHDEIGLSVKDLDEARKAKKIMENAIEMAVPFVCDIDIGPSWGEAKEVDLR